MTYEQGDLFVESTRENEMEQCEDKDKELTTRQWRTHDLIVRNSQMGKVTTQREIYENYPFDAISRKDGYVWKDNPKAHDHCTPIWTDINKINACDKVHKIIIPNNFTYKVAETQQEVNDFTEEYYFQPAMAKLWRYANLRRKAKRDGQGRLPLKEDSKEREYFESFVKQIIERELNNEEEHRD